MQLCRAANCVYNSDVKIVHSFLISRNIFYNLCKCEKLNLKNVHGLASCEVIEYFSFSVSALKRNGVFPYTFEIVATPTRMCSIHIKSTVTKSLHILRCHVHQHSIDQPDFLFCSLSHLGRAHTFPLP